MWKILCFVFSLFSVNDAALEPGNGAAELQNSTQDNSHSVLGSLTQH